MNNPIFITNNSISQKDWISSMNEDSEMESSLIRNYTSLSFSYYDFPQTNLDKEAFFDYKSAGNSILEQWRLLQNCQFITLNTASLSSETSFTVNAAQFLPRLTFLKMSSLSSYEQLIDLTAIDHIKQNQRFEVVYQLLSITHSKRITFSVYTSEGLSIDSAVNIYINSGWYEREVWDRFGIFFSNHPDLRRRLTDYGFKGHPLRKDFPGTGYVEVRYNGYTKSISYEKVNLQQASRETTVLQLRNVDVLKLWF